MRRFEEKIKSWLSQTLIKSGMKTPLNNYIENSFRYSALTSIFFFTFWALFFEDLFTAIVASFAFFGLNLLFWAYYPVTKKNKRAELIEKDLPFALMNLSIQLNIENRFEKALKKISTKNYSLLGRELKIVLQEIEEGGASVQQALYNLTERVDSETLKRAVMKLVTIYEQGGGGRLKGEAIKSLAKEGLSAQKAKLKEFSQKLVLYSLMFIVISAIFPALFQAFVIVGSTFMKLNFSTLQIILIVTVVFPILDLSALLFIKSKTPIFLK